MPLTIDFPASTTSDISRISPFRNDRKRQMISHQDICGFELVEGNVVISYYDERTGSNERFAHTFRSNITPSELWETVIIIRNRAKKRADDAKDFTAPWELYTE